MQQDFSISVSAHAYQQLEKLGASSPEAKRKLIDLVLEEYLDDQFCHRLAKEGEASGYLSAEESQALMQQILNDAR